jgi:hypothetical protein
MKQIAFALLFPLAAHAAGFRELTFVNKCSKTTLTAFTSHVDSIGDREDVRGLSKYWATEGWLPLKPGASHTARIADSRVAAALVQLEDGTVLTANQGTFCVTGKAFSAREYAKGGKSQYFVVGYDETVGHGATCAGAGGHLRSGFQTLELNNNRKYTLNILCH